MEKNSTNSKIEKSVISYRPYFKKGNQHQYLATIASLNGGNVINNYIDFLVKAGNLSQHQPLTELEQTTARKMIFEKFSRKIDELTNNNSSDSPPISVTCNPSLFGERNLSDSDFTGLQLSNIRHKFDHFEIYISIVIGILSNLLNLAGPDILNLKNSQKNFYQIFISGGVYQKNQKILNPFLKNYFKNSCEIIENLESCDSSFGAMCYLTQMDEVHL